MKLDDVHDHELVKSLRSETCPMCGSTKTRGMTFCPKDFYSLPKPMRGNLYHQLGEGYEEAVKAAFEYYEQTEFLTET